MKEFISKINPKQYFQFITVGGIGVILNLALLFLFTEFIGMYYILSESLAFFIATVNNFILNKVWTFKENLKNDPFKKLIQYLGISMIGVTINLSVLFLLVEFFSIWYMIAEIFATAASSVVNYLGNKFWTFKDKSLSK